MRASSGWRAPLTPGGCVVRGRTGWREVALSWRWSALLVLATLFGARALEAREEDRQGEAAEDRALSQKLQALRRVDLEIQSQLSQIQSLSLQLEVLKRRELELGEQLQETQSARARLQGQLGRQLKVRRQLRGREVARFFLSAGGPQALIRRREALRRLLARDLTLAESLADQLRQLREEETSLRETRARIEALRAERLSAQASLADRRAEEGRLLGFKGNPRRSLSAPLLGRRVSKFGLRRVSEKHRLVENGVWFEATDREAAFVYPASPGEVIFVGALQGWGEVVIIEHEAKVHTIYGHLKRAQVRRGRRVTPISKIAWAREGRLYFELRLAGQPINPARWLPAAPPAK